MNDSIIFLSDTHFKYHIIDDDERKKREYFLDFLERIRGIRKLYLVGDIFDFWFEYASAIPRYYHDILDGLCMVQKSGTEIFIVGGNHDFWLGSYISHALGFTILPPVSTHELQGKRVTVTHGDMLLKGDYAYKTLKALIRSRPVIAIARLFHPDFLYGFARSFSKASKEITQKKTEESARRLMHMAPRSFFRWKNDVFVMGHIHYPYLQRFDEKVFVILGDWEQHYSYLHLKDGRLSLECYKPGENTLSENL